jgi:hypothetical protein
VINNASAKAERSADVCVRERDTAALGDVAKDVCVGAIERLLGRLAPAKADGAQLDGSKQLVGTGRRSHPKPAEDDSLSSIQKSVIAVATAITAMPTGGLGE